MIHWLSKSIFLKKETKGHKHSRNGVKNSSTIHLSHLKGPFIIQFFITLSELSRQVNVTSLALEWRSCNHARPFSFVPPLSFTKLEHCIAFTAKPQPLRLW